MTKHTETYYNSKKKRQQIDALLHANAAYQAQHTCVGNSPSKKNEMTITQGNNFLDLIAVQYQMKDLDTSQGMILGLAMQKTFNQIKGS